jgi:hypothetical protein
MQPTGQRLDVLPVWVLTRVPYPPCPNLCLNIVNLSLYVVNLVGSSCCLRADNLAVKGGPTPGPRQKPPSLSGSQGVVLRLSQVILRLVVFSSFPVGACERICRM